MSCYTIYMKDGHKMMRPVRSKDEYKALRESEQNRRADKQHMVQMCYSCLPAPSAGERSDTQDYPLKGCTTPSTTVGMDVDLPQAEAQDVTKLREIQDKILAKKGELGLLMLERSATKGFHIVFRRRPDKTQEENLRWASDLLGVEYDKGAKDITRVFYTPADKLIYLDDELFEQKEASNTERVIEGKNRAAEPSVGTAGKPSLGTAEPSQDKAAPPSSLTPLPSSLNPLPSTLIAFDLCVKEAGLSADSMDVWGEHNWHSNLMAVLSVGLPKLMSKEQLYAVVREKLPNYSQTEDCRKLIEYFYENYTADKGFMSTTLRDINAQAQRLSLAHTQKGRGEDAANEKLVEALSIGWAPPEVPEKLPRLMSLLVNNYDPRFRQMLLLASLPILSAHASHFRAKYLDGKIIGPNQFVAIIGGSGSGKGNATDLFRDMVRNTLQASDDREWDKVKENAEQRDKLANAKERPPKYHPRLRLFESTSKSSILELQSNLGKNSMLLGQFSEVDGFAGAAKSAWSNITVLMRKGWDMDMQRQYYMSDSTCNTYTQMSISLLMAGTVKAMLKRMFSDDNCESGFMQRFIPVIMPKTKRTFRPPMQNFLSEDEKQERDALLMQLYQKDVALGDGIKVLETPMMEQAIGEWFDELEQRYSDGQMTEAEADLSHRCGQFMLRAAIPLVALYGKETPEIVNLCRWVGEMAFYNISRLFGLRVQQDLIDSEELLTALPDARKTVEPILEKMPNVFTSQQLSEERVKEGQSPDVSTLLCRYCKSGKVVRVSRGVYRKAT